MVVRRLCLGKPAQFALMQSDHPELTRIAKSCFHRIPIARKPRINIDDSGKNQGAGLEDHMPLHVHWGWQVLVFGEQFQQLGIQ